MNENCTPDVAVRRDPEEVVPLDEALEAVRVELDAGTGHVSLTAGEARALLDAIELAR